MATTTQRPSIDAAVTRRRRSGRLTYGVSAVLAARISVQGIVGRTFANGTAYPDDGSDMWRAPALDEHLDHGRATRAVAR